ncbi:MAG: response regulator transcription factor [Ignavibacteriaceae bacterium]|jgi:DNA-binding NarL/FixJ family response regulator
MKRKLRILLIEDNRLLRDGLTIMLKKQKDMDVVATIGNGENILSILKKYKPEVLLLDLGLRDRSSLNLVKTVNKNSPDAKIIVMDLIPMQTDVFEFVQAGVSGFIMKDANVFDFLKTIRSVAKGLQVLPSNLTESLFSQIVNHAVNGSKPSSLLEAVRMTKRERQVIELISEGHSNKEIAQKLHLSTYTVKSHVHNILEKLALNSRVQIAKYAHDSEKIKSAFDDISLLED